MNSGLECDIQKTFSDFMELTAQEMTKCTRRALVKGAKELQSHTKQSARNSFKTRDNEHWYDGKIVTYNDKIEDAVMIGKIEGDFSEDMSIKVHIMGSPKKGSGTFRLRFLEKDTKEREVKHYRDRNHELKLYKKPKKVGKITGRWFFKNSQQAVFPNLPSIYMAEIEKTIQKLNNGN